MDRISGMFKFWASTPRGDGTYYLGREGQAALINFKYSGQDNSLLYKHLLSPLADYCVNHLTPRWLAPNSITLIGLCFQVLAFAVAFYHSPDMLTPPPWWSYLLTAACLFIYSTADNMDGKQARRTGSSSPLGLLFDHGCDAVNAGLLGWSAAAIHVQAGCSWRAYGMWAMACVPFFYNTWEEFHTGSLILPTINGPNEGVMGLASMLVMTAYFGPELWPRSHTFSPLARWALTPAIDLMRTLAGEGVSLGKHAQESVGDYLAVWSMGASAAPSDAGLPITNLEMLLGMTSGVVLITVLYQLANVLGREWWGRGSDGVARAIARQSPFAALVLLMSAWLHNEACRAVVHEHWALFYGVAGALFVDMTVRLMVAHVSHQEYSIEAAGLLVFSIAPVALRLDLVPAGVDKASFASLSLLTSLVTAWLPCMAYVFNVTREVATTLDIDVFDISRQVERAGAAASKAAGSATRAGAGASALSQVGVSGEEGALWVHEQAYGTPAPSGRKGGGRAGARSDTPSRRRASSTSRTAEKRRL